MRRTVQRLRLTLAADDEARRRHRSGDYPEHAGACGCRALAVHDQLTLNTLDHVAFFPREVVVVLDVEDYIRAELAHDVVVDERVVGRSVMAHQVHRIPVFLARCFFERKPCEVFQFLRQPAVAIHRDAAVVLANLRACSARAAVRKQREVFARLKAERLRLLPVDG